jgi:alkylation response protein AidB-like acyl-CoA dehydrogenase
MKRTLFTEEHIMFRETVRRFIEKEIKPYHETWEHDGIVPRELFLKAGASGLLCMNVPEAYGGGGVDDFRYNIILAEELTRANCTGPGFSLQTDVAVPYILHFGNEEQKRRWLPKLCSGEHIIAIAMTEPSGGTDLASMKTRAIRTGDQYVMNGSKTFITNGINADLVIVACKTNPEEAHTGMSLMVVERDMAGFMRGRNLEKVGWHAQDTAELFFEDVHVPVENRLGDEGMGFFYLVNQLPQERLIIAAGAIAGAEAALDWTIDYCQSRQAFGRPIGTFQNSRFKLAEMKTEIQIGRVFIDQCIELHTRGELNADTAAMAKWWTTDLQHRVVDQCLQLHGGYGYMLEYPIAKAYIDMRWAPIGGGTNEIMKELIGKAMGF